MSTSVGKRPQRHAQIVTIAHAFGLNRPPGAWRQRATIARQEALMSDLQTREYALKAGQSEFLEQSAREFKLEDAGKALRCLINYARENPDKANEIFDEVRCMGC